MADSKETAQRRARFEAWFTNSGDYEPEWLDRGGACPQMYMNADTENQYQAYLGGCAEASLDHTQLLFSILTEMEELDKNGALPFPLEGKLEQGLALFKSSPFADLATPSPPVAAPPATPVAPTDAEILQWWREGGTLMHRPPYAVIRAALAKWAQPQPQPAQPLTGASQDTVSGLRDALLQISAKAQLAADVCDSSPHIQKAFEILRDAATLALVQPPASCQSGHPSPGLIAAYAKGFYAAAGWAKRPDLYADIGSPAYVSEREELLCITAPSTPTPEVAHFSQPGQGHKIEVYTLAALTQGAGEAVEPVGLWAVNVQGPDDVYPCESRLAALEMANTLNASFIAQQEQDHHEYDPIMRAVVIPWEHSPEEHAAAIRAKGTHD